MHSGYAFWLCVHVSLCHPLMPLGCTACYEPRPIIAPHHISIVRGIENMQSQTSSHFVECTQFLFMQTCILLLLAPRNHISASLCHLKCTYIITFPWNTMILINMTQITKMSKWDKYHSVSYTFILACIFVFLFAFSVSFSSLMPCVLWERAPYWRERIPKWSIASLKSNGAYLSFVQGILFQLCCLMCHSLTHK